MDIQNTSTKVDKVWGNEEWIINTDKYCMKHLNLKENFRCSLHYHKEKDETFVIFSGKVYMEIVNELDVLEGFMMLPGDKIRIKPGIPHRFSGMQNSLIVEVSTHHDDADSYRDDISGKFDPESIE